MGNSLLRGLAMLLLAGIWMMPPDWLQLALVLLSGVPVLLLGITGCVAGRPSPGAVADALLQLEPSQLARYHQLVSTPTISSVGMTRMADCGTSPMCIACWATTSTNCLGLQLFQYIHPDDLAVFIWRGPICWPNVRCGNCYLQDSARNGEWIWLEMFARLFDLGPWANR